MKILLLTLFMLAAAPIVQQWNKLGDVTITNKLDNESIIINGKDASRTIRIKAANAAVQITAIDLYYESGEVQNLTKRLTIDMGKESEPIQLKNGQVLKKIVFFYKLFAGKDNEEVLVELYGMR